MAKRWVSNAHRRLMTVEWSNPPEPEFFDHQIDLFHQWLAGRNPLWLERGIFGDWRYEGEPCWSFPAGTVLTRVTFTVYGPDGLSPVILTRRR